MRAKTGNGKVPHKQTKKARSWKKLAFPLSLLHVDTRFFPAGTISLQDLSWWVTQSESQLEVRSATSISWIQYSVSKAPQKKAPALNAKMYVGAKFFFKNSWQIIPKSSSKPDQQKIRTSVCLVPGKHIRLLLTPLRWTSEKCLQPTLTWPIPSTEKWSHLPTWLQSWNSRRVPLAPEQCNMAMEEWNVITLKGVINKSVRHVRQTDTLACIELFFFIA